MFMSIQSKHIVSLSFHNPFPFSVILILQPTLTLSQTSLVFTCLQYNSFENTVGNGEITRYKQFLLFPVFSTCIENFLPFSSKLNLSTAKSLVWRSLKIVVWKRINKKFFIDPTCWRSSTLSQTTNFRIFQIERVCKRQF